MALSIYNSLTRREESFTPGDPDRVTMYVCGPTVYSYAHIGNARPEVVFDVLARLLRRRYRLVYARNFTDVDDKINAAARREGVEIGVLTARYIDAFHRDVAALGVRAPDIEPRVTAHMPEIVGFIARLIASGHAYEAEGHVLFSVPSFSEYGRLSGRSTEDLIAGARVEVAPYKRDPADFVLWKPSEAGLVGWDSPWGRGRPGWHIECSTMIETHLGATIDIHGGGQDLVFPHHENEIAQSTCAHGGQLFCRYWMHNGHVQMASEKMSKSLGNLLLLKDLLADAPAEAVRLGLLTAHYRQPLDWTAQLLEESVQKLDRMYGALREAGVAGAAPEAPARIPDAVLEALEDDLNTPRALAALFALARDANRCPDPGERRRIAGELRAGGWLLGLLEQDPEAWFAAGRGADGDGLDAAAIQSLVEKRDAMRRERSFAEADRIRDELANRGIVIEDRADGSRWRRTH
jgi:cysteinyl-tRNA synthetase